MSYSLLAIKILQNSFWISSFLVGLNELLYTDFFTNFDQWIWPQVQNNFFLEHLFLKNSYYEKQLFLNRISQWLLPTTFTLRAANGWFRPPPLGLLSFIYSRNTYAMQIKFCPSEQYLVANILNSKLFLHLASKHEWARCSYLKTVTIYRPELSEK